MAGTAAVAISELVVTMRFLGIGTGLLIATVRI
jgi:hypothetical protein